MISTATLDAAVSAVPVKAQIMPGSVRRWIPASSGKMRDGSPVTPEFIADLVARLNAEAVSIPIDGGMPGSVAHETAHDYAIGWAHRGAMVDGHMFLEAEVRPSVSAGIDDGSLAFSSIDADYLVDEAGAYVAGSAHLITHALTNTPRDREMLPMQAVATHERKRTLHSYTRARLAVDGDDMSKKTKTEEQAAETVQNVQAEAPATETAAPPDAPPEASGEMDLAAAMAKITELEAELAAAKAASEEMSARLAEQPVGETAEQVRETACVAVVDDAIKAGRIGKDSREKWLAVARQSVEHARKALATIPARAQRITQASENSPAADKAEEWSEDEQHLARLLRTGGQSEANIKATIARKRAAG